MAIGRESLMKLIYISADHYSIDNNILWAQKQMIFHYKSYLPTEWILLPFIILQWFYVQQATWPAFKNYEALKIKTRLAWKETD